MNPQLYIKLMKRSVKVPQKEKELSSMVTVLFTYTLILPKYEGTYKGQRLCVNQLCRVIYIDTF